VHHYINGNWQEQAYLAQVDDQGQYRTDFNGTGYLVMDHGSMGSTGWQGKLCRLFDVDVAPDGSVVATGYRNPNPGATLRSVHVIRVLDVPGTTSNVSVAEARPLPTLAVFPNPTQGLFQVDAPTAGHYALYNALGGLVQQGYLQVGPNTLQMGGELSPGVYLLQVGIGTGLGPQVLRIVKE
jgi:hypothetical protein